LVQNFPLLDAPLGVTVVGAAPCETGLPCGLAASTFTEDETKESTVEMPKPNPFGRKFLS
jgi:hypothetical protein